MNGMRCEVSAILFVWFLLLLVVARNACLNISCYYVVKTHLFFYQCRYFDLSIGRSLYLQGEM